VILPAVDAGINLVDTSNQYRKGKAEPEIGVVLEERKRCEEAFITTKAPYPTTRPHRLGELEAANDPEF